MLFRPIIFYNPQVGDNAFLYRVDYHYTKNKIDKNLICRGKICSLCKFGLKKYEKFLIPVFMVYRNYITCKVLYEDYEIARKIFQIIAGHIEDFNTNEIFNKKRVPFIENLKLTVIDTTNLKPGKSMKYLGDILKKFEEKYVFERFSNDDQLYFYFIDNFLKKS